MALVIGIAAFAGIFILFLVLSKTLNNTVNHLVKITYLLQKEFDLKKERVAIAQLLEDEKNKPGSSQDGDSSDNGEGSRPDSAIADTNGKKK